MQLEDLINDRRRFVCKEMDAIKEEVFARQQRLDELSAEYTMCNAALTAIRKGEGEAWENPHKEDEIADIVCAEFPRSRDESRIWMIKILHVLKDNKGWMFCKDIFDAIDRVPAGTTSMTISYHLSQLKKAGIICARMHDNPVDGRMIWSFYGGVPTSQPEEAA